ncbi:unnamed protein product [Spirodela intermedia]|uniref:Uncharacterized protein n=1 Tax=Spirodela intermedia TaxID=51605 RepID=A0ABN7ECS0_SPIIN|nr:unnamed protein product [Spirodela intermedia]
MAVVAEEQGRASEICRRSASPSSYRSPRRADACRSAAVSSAFLAAASSGLSGGASCRRTTKRSFRCCRRPAGVPVEEGALTLGSAIPSSLSAAGKVSMISSRLERATGRKCVTLSARDLNIVWGDSPITGGGRPSRTRGGGALERVLAGDRGKIACRMLSPKTTYVAHLVFKLSVESHGLDYPSQEGSIRAGSRVSSEEVCLHPAPSSAARPAPIPSSGSGACFQWGRRLRRRRRRRRRSGRSPAPERRVDGGADRGFLNDDVDEEESRSLSRRSGGPLEERACC